jgi:hypothetical protein
MPDYGLVSVWFSGFVGGVAASAFLAAAILSGRARRRRRHEKFMNRFNSLG